LDRRPLWKSRSIGSPTSSRTHFAARRLSSSAVSRPRLRGAVLRFAHGRDRTAPRRHDTVRSARSPHSAPLPGVVLTRVGQRLRAVTIGLAEYSEGRARAPSDERERRPDEETEERVRGQAKSFIGRWLAGPALSRVSPRQRPKYLPNSRMHSKIGPLIVLLPGRHRAPMEGIQ